MMSFASPRERRLWLAALAVLLAIYASIPLAGRLAEWLQNHGLMNAVAFSFGGAFLAAVAAVFGLGLRRRPTPAELWVGVAVTVAFVMIVVRMGVSPVERTHLFEYGLLAVLLYEAAAERRRAGGRTPSPALVAVALTATLGWGDEAIQSYLPGRVYDLRDVGVNALAGLVATGAAATLAWIRRRRDRNSSAPPGTSP